LSCLTEKERYFRTMRYEDVDRRPLHLVGFWHDTVARWHTEGLPGDITEEKIHEYLGVESKKLRMINVTGESGLYPAFEKKILKEDGDFVDSIDAYGRTIREFKNHTSMPEWIDFPVKTSNDLRHILDNHFDVSGMEARFSQKWEQKISEALNSDAVILLNGGGYYWMLRSIAGVENASYLLYDAPELVEELFERYYTVVAEGFKRVCPQIKVDVIGFGEDLAYNSGLLLSLDMFRKMILPRYARAMSLARENEIEFTWYDSDGDLRQLLDDLISTGINGIAPTEVAANMVPVELRKQFGRDLRIIGGIDKREIAKDKETIDAEISRNQELIDEGGFIPAIDHSVSSDISWDNYQYYIEKIQKALKQ